MADQKISQLTALTGANAAADDQLAIVDTNVAETKKISREEFFKNTPDIGAGTSSPIERLTVVGSVQSAGFYRNVNVASVGDAANFIGLGSLNGTTPTPGAAVGSILAGNAASGQLYFSTRSGGALTERMRIDSSGNVLVGKTVTTYTTNGVSLSNIGSNFSHTSGAVVAVNRNGTDGNAVELYKAGDLVGSISVTASATAYNTSSDYRLKENIAPMTGALAKVDALKPCTYTWKANGSAGQGFIAHELQAVVPDAVTGEKDAVDEEGNPKYQGVDTSFLVATLTAAIQELKAELDTVKAELNQIKGA